MPESVDPINVEVKGSFFLFCLHIINSPYHLNLLPTAYSSSSFTPPDLMILAWNF